MEQHSFTHIGRLIVGRWNGDVIAGNHLRDFAIEEKAAAEALQHLLARTEPKKVSWRVFAVHEGEWRNAEPWEKEAHYRWRVYAYWTAMREVFAAGKPKRRRARLAPLALAAEQERWTIRARTTKKLRRTAA